MIVKSIFQAGDLTMVLTAAKTTFNVETIVFVLTFGFIIGFARFRSLFFYLAFQNETIYKVASSRKSKTKKRKIQLRQLPPNGQEQTLTPSTTTVFRSHEVMHNLRVS